MTHRTPQRRLAGRVLPAALALTVVPAALRAQAMPAAESSVNGAGPGWLAWYGCWTATRDGEDGAPATGTGRRLCVLPAGSEAVEVRTIDGGRVTRTDTIDASGARRARAREGCRGWEQASWSQDRRRVFTQSEYACEGGTTRTVRGVLALTPDGEWIDVRAVNAGRPAGVQVARFRPLTTPAGEVPAIDALLAGRGLAIDAARRSAGVSLTPELVAEASRRAGGNSTAAWVATVGQPFALTGRQLLALQQAGVPGQVTDIMIAVSNPQVFTIASADGQGTPRAAERASRGLATGAPGQTVVLRPSTWDPFWALGYGSYAYGLGYGSGYGYGRGYGRYYPGGWFAGGVPVAIVRPVTPEPRTRLTNGAGYSQDGGTPAAAAYPRDRSSASDGRTSTSSSGSSGGSSGGSSSQGGSSSSDGGRAAKPRP